MSRLGTDGYAWEDYPRDILAGNLTARVVLPNLVSTTHGPRGFTGMVYLATVELLCEYVEARFTGHPDVREQVVMRTYIHGMVDMLEDWIREGMNESYSGLVDGLCEAFPPLLVAYVPVRHGEPPRA